MNLKVGDKVRIKSKEWFKNQGFFSSDSSISDCYGKEATITERMEYGYSINIGPKCIFWQETAFEPMSDWAVNIPKDTELTKTVTVNMPNDLDVSTVEYDGKITINIQHKEVEGPKFKNGDIIYSKTYSGYSYIAIYKGPSSNESLISYHVMLSGNDYIIFDGICSADNFRLATKREEEMLFHELANQKKLHWNAEELKFEEYRWRAEKGGEYWYISAIGEVCSFIDNYLSCDNTIFKLRNYFETEDIANKALPKLKEFYKNLNIK